MDSPTSCSLTPNQSNSLWTWLIDRFRQLCGYRFPPLGPVAFAGIFKALPPTIETRLFPGIKAILDLHDETQRTTYWFGTRFEAPTPQILREWASEATHFFDIGSNYGFYSFFLHSVFSHLHIYPFEPNPASFRRLLDICTINRTVRIQPQPYGLSDEDKRLEFLQLTDNTGHSSFATVEAYADRNPLLAGASLTKCDVIPFDQAIRRLGLSYPAKPGWVAKIDVEGYEMKVLLGMAEALRNKAFKGICIELVAENLSLCGTSIEQVDTLLRSCDYHQMPGLEIEHDHRGRNHNAFYVPKEVGISRQRAAQ